MDLETRLLQQILSQAHQLPEVLLLKPVTASTNDDVREIALKGVQQVLVASVRQTQGRGQRQRGHRARARVDDLRGDLDGPQAPEREPPGQAGVRRAGAPERRARVHVRLWRRHPVHGLLLQ